MSTISPSIAIIGLGPRGVSTLERLVAHFNAVEKPPQEFHLHLIDDAQHGGGRIWDITQTKALCMNTFAHGMTLFRSPARRWRRRWWKAPRFMSGCACT